jgi:hypothetical protein
MGAVCVRRAGAKTGLRRRPQPGHPDASAAQHCPDAIFAAARPLDVAVAGRPLQEVTSKRQFLDTDHPHKYARTG